MRLQRRVALGHPRRMEMARCFTAAPPLSPVGEGTLERLRPTSAITLIALLAISLVSLGCSNAGRTNTVGELHVGCLVKPDPGPCRADRKHFYYDYRDDRCKAFYYGGCKGRVPFQTLEECQSFCGGSG